MNEPNALAGSRSVAAITAALTGTDLRPLLIEIASDRDGSVVAFVQALVGHAAALLLLQAKAQGIDPLEMVQGLGLIYAREQT